MSACDGPAPVGQLAVTPLCTHHLGEERPAVSVGELSSPVSRAPIGRLILHGIICPWHSSGAMSSVNAVTHPATPPGDYWVPELWALAASSSSVLLPAIPLDHAGLPDRLAPRARRPGGAPFAQRAPEGECADRRSRVCRAAPAALAPPPPSSQCSQRVCRQDRWASGFACVDV